MVYFRVYIPLLAKEGWLRGQEDDAKHRYSRADGVVAHTVSDTVRSITCERPPLLCKEGNTLSRAMSLLVRPPPTGNLRAVDAVLVCVGTAGDLVVAEFLPRVTSDFLEPRNPVDGVDRKAEAIGFIVHRQLHRGVDVAFLLVAAHVQLTVLASISQAVNQPRISMEVEDDGLVNRE